MSEVHVKEGESLDSALKRFKRSCAKAGVLAEVRRRECYESPSVKRRCPQEQKQEILLIVSTSVLNVCVQHASVCQKGFLTN